VPLLVAGSGLGLLVSQLNNYTLSPIEPEHVSEAAGVNSAGGSFGLAFGLAFAGAIMLASLSLVFTHMANASSVLTPAEKDKVATQLQKNAEVMTNTHLEALLVGQPADVKAEILHINEKARPIALQIALLVPLLAGLLGLVNGFRMTRLPDLEPSAAAETVLGEALKGEPDQPELLYDYALTAERLEKFDVLEENLRKLIEVRPDHAHAYNALGYSFADRNTRLKEARTLIEKALELAPDDFFIMDSLGWVQYREGNLKGAAATLRRAYNGRPDAEIGAHLGEVLWVMGERNEANRVWQESLKSAPDNETLQKTIKRLRR